MLYSEKTYWAARQRKARKGTYYKDGCPRGADLVAIARSLKGPRGALGPWKPQLPFLPYRAGFRKSAFY